MADCGFPKTYRLLNAADFQAVFSHSRFKVSCRYFLVLATSNQNTNSRLGIIVAKKNIASAVQRNRLKRLIRNWFRCHRDLAENLDLVVMVRRDADKLSNAQLTQRLAGLWEDLNGKCQTQPHH